MRRLSGILATIKSCDASRYDASVAAVAVVEQRRAEARPELFSENELPGQPDDEWQRFAAAGDTYRSIWVQSVTVDVSRHRRRRAEPGANDGTGGNSGVSVGHEGLRLCEMRKL